MSLDDLGFLPTVERYLHQTEIYRDPDNASTSRGSRARLPEKLEINVFRLVQEAVKMRSSMQSHQRIIVNIEQGSDVIHLHIRDYGGCFDPSLIGEESFGIVGMRERIELVNGTANLTRRLAKGQSSACRFRFRETTRGKIHMEMTQTRIAIVDDHELFREGIKAHL